MLSLSKAFYIYVSEAYNCIRRQVMVIIDLISSDEPVIQQVAALVVEGFARERLNQLCDRVN